MSNFLNCYQEYCLGKVTKSGVSDASNILIINIFLTVGSYINPNPSGIGLKTKYICFYSKNSDIVTPGRVRA